VSAPFSANSDIETPTSLEAFRAFFEAERPGLAAALLRKLTEHAPHYRTMSEEQRSQRVNDNLDAYLAGLDDPNQLANVSEQQLSPLMAQGLDLDVALRLTSIYRQQLLNVALRGLELGVEGAADGLRALMELVDMRVRALSRIYQDRLRLFETLVHNSPDAIGVSSLDGKQIHPNPAFHALLGYGDELIGMDYSGYVEDDDPTIMQQLMEQGSWQGVTGYRRKDGSNVRCLSTIFLIPGPDGQPCALGGVMHDLTEQLRAADELKRQAEELRTVADRLEQSFSSTPLATIEWDATGTITRWNPSAERIFGWTAAEALGKNAITLVAPYIPPGDVQHIINQHLRGEVVNSRFQNVTKDGREITCQWYNALLRDPAGEVVGVLAQAEDLSEHLRAEQERAALQEQVIEAQQAALRELSTPLIPLADGVVAMPLIGSIDSLRAQQVVEELLQGVSGNHASTAIIDITGVPVVDTQVAGAFLRAAQAVELLGARVIITGIRPEVAQTLVGIGVNLGSIVTRSTLQDGISHALQWRK